MALSVRKVCDDCGTSTVTEALLILKEAKEGCSCGCPQPPKFTVLSKPSKP